MRGMEIVNIIGPTCRIILFVQLASTADECVFLSLSNTCFMMQESSLED